MEQNLNAFEQSSLLKHPLGCICYRDCSLTLGTKRDSVPVFVPPSAMHQLPLNSMI